jgi:S1-C subfamily serine protease
VISSFSDEGVILTSAKIDQGNSGGLAVDQKGCMVGVPVAVSEGTYQNLGVIISTDLILEFSDKLDTILNEQ